MAKNPPTTLQTLYRSTVMIGTLACASMAYYRYGPPPEELAGMIDDAVGMVAELQESLPDTAGQSNSVEEEELSTLAIEAPIATNPQPETELKYDTNITQASALQPLAQTPASNRSSELSLLDKEQLVAPLLSAGAVEADITTWGRRGEAYRATVAIPAIQGTSGLMKRFDAIASTPDQAVADVLAQMGR